MKRIEKINHILWFVIGIFVLGFLSYGAYRLIDEVLNPKHHRWEEEKDVLTNEELAKAKAGSLALPDIRISLPKKIVGTEYNFFKLECMDVDIEGPHSQVSYDSSSKLFNPHYSRAQNWVNIFFFKDDYSDAHLLLDTKKIIILMEAPGESDTLQDFILYGIVSEDTNGDGRMNCYDDLHLYLSDISGHGLHRITDETIHLLYHEIVQEESRIYILAQNIPEDKESTGEYWEEELYVYDVEKGELSSPLRDHRFISKAREILWQ